LEEEECLLAKFFFSLKARLFSLFFSKTMYEKRGVDQKGPSILLSAPFFQKQPAEMTGPLVNVSACLYARE
jgi:hypothetical protein